MIPGQRAATPLLLLALVLVLDLSLGAAPCVQNATNVAWTIADVSAALDGAAPCENAGVCVDGHCDCVCGFKGDHCEIRKEPLAGIYVLAFALSFALLLGSAFALYRHDKGNNYADFAAVIPDQASVANIGGQARGRQILLLVRGVFCAYALAVQIYQWNRNRSIDIYRFYTIWNWTLLLTVFSVGTAVSLKALFSPPKIPTRSLSRLQTVFWVLLEVELTTAALVDLVTWSILYPASTDGSFLHFTSYNQHGVNIGLMGIEFLLNGLPLAPWHCLYVVVWACLYSIFELTSTAINDARGVPHCPVYFFLDASSWALPVWLLGLCAMHCLMFCALYWLYRCACTRCKQKHGSNCHI